MGPFQAEEKKCQHQGWIWKSVRAAAQSPFPGCFPARQPAAWGPQDVEQGRKDPPTLREGQVRDHLRNLNRQQSMGSDEVHPRVLRKLADVVVKTLSIIFERSQQSGEVPGDWKKGSIVPILQKGRKEDPGK